MSTAVTRPSLRKPILTRASSDGRARPMKCSSSRLMRIITGAPVFFASSAGTAMVMRPGNLAAEAAARVFADDARPVRRCDADPSRHRRDRPHDALRRAVQIELAVLPVRHRRARFERLVARRLRVECLVEDESRLLEAGVEIAVRPLRPGFPDRAERRRPRRQSRSRSI